MLPCADHICLDLFDNLLRQRISSITNSNLSDIQWTQASLPVKDGGLGIRRVASLATSAFLASAAGTLDIQDQILNSCQSLPDHSVTTARTTWSTCHNLPCPVLPDAAKQQSWDQPNLS